MAARQGLSGVLLYFAFGWLIFTFLTYKNTFSSRNHLALQSNFVINSGRCRVQPYLAKMRRHLPLGVKAVDSTPITENEAKKSSSKNGVEISTNEVSESKLRMEVVLPSDFCKKILNKQVKKLGENVTIPGFRKNLKKKTKIPQDLIIGTIGRQRVEASVVEELIQSTVWDALNEVKDIALPKSEEISLGDRTRSVFDHIQTKDPYKYTVTVEIIPKVRWAKQYKDLTVAIESLDADKEFQKKILRIRKRFGEEEIVDRGFTEEDFAIVSYTFQKLPEDGGGPIYASLGVDAPMFMHRRDDGTEVRAVKYDPQEHSLLPGIHEALLGMKEGDKKEIRVSIPEDFELSSVTGVDAVLKLQLEDLRHQILKPMEDGLAPWLASGATNIDEAMTRGLDELKTELKQREDEALKDAITNAVATNVINEIPKRVLYQTAVQLYMDSLPKNRGMTHDIESAPTLVERYINQNQRKVETTARARMGLRAIADAESIEVPDDEIQPIVDRIIASQPKRKDENGNPIEEEIPDIKETKEWKNTKYSLEMDKALEWLKDNITIDRVSRS